MTNAGSTSDVGRAEALAESGRTAEALTLLDSLARQGNAEACFTSGAWAFSGQYIKRDIAAARRFFELAASAGHSQAETILIAFLGNGTGGPRDWGRAVALLSKRAERDEAARRQLDILRSMKLGEGGDPTVPPRGRDLSHQPQVRLFEGLLTPAECRFLIAEAEPYFSPSVVVDPNSGNFIRNPVRTSDAAAFPLASENPAIHALNRRLAAASGTDVDQGEPLQILRYAPGQEYRPHSDALIGEANQRRYTVLVYLNEGFDGGETHFLANGLKVRGREGDALMFVNASDDGRPDPDARHAGLPVTRGTKLIASRWIRASKLDLTAVSG